MKKIRKILALFLSLIIIGGALPATALAASTTESPVFEIVKTGQDGNVVTVAVNLVSGTFNAMDFQFNMSAGVTCNSISVVRGGIGNPFNGKASVVTSDAYPLGTVITASFTVPENAEYSISGSVPDCAKTDGGANITVIAEVTGSVTDKPVSTTPVFEIVKTGQDGNVITVAVNLVSGKFNAMDFQFNMSEGVTCNSISAVGGLGNKANGKVSMVSVNAYSTGTLITASFTVPENTAYSISGTLEKCEVTMDDGFTVPVSAIMNGSVSYVPDLPKCGDKVYYSFDEYSGVLTISGTGPMYDFDEDNMSPFYDYFSVDITSVVITNGVTRIGDISFYGCTSIEDITIPDSVTSLGMGAFAYCESLTDIVLPDNITGIDYGTFIYCENLISIELPGKLTSIGEVAFLGCSSLESISLPEGLESIGAEAFEECVSLTDITLPDSLTSIGQGAFVYCENLWQITIPENVSYIGLFPFGGCPISAINVSSSNDYYCSDNGVLFNNRMTELIEYPAANARASYTVPEGVKYIKNSAFAYCPFLTAVTIPNSVEIIEDDAFAGCEDLTIYCYENSGAHEYAVDNDIPFVIIEEEVEETEETGRCGKNVYYSYNEKTGVLTISGTGDMYDYDSMYGESSPFNRIIKSVVIEEGVTSIGDEAFESCSELTSISIPSSVKSIGFWAFYRCAKLTSVTVPDSVTEINSYAFDEIINVNYHGTADYSPWGAKVVNGYIENNLIYADSSKKTLVACFRTATGNIDIPSSVTRIEDSAFKSCIGITGVTIPNSVTSIGESTFENCMGLTSVTIPNSVTSIGENAFFNCPILTDLIIPDSVTGIGDDAFGWCYKLMNITIPNSVTSIGKRAFSGISNINYHGTADGSPWGADAVNGYVDYDGYIENNLVYTDSGKTVLVSCNKLATGNIVIPDSVVEIEYSAFSNCTGLTGITIPDSVKSIGNSAFYGCINLENIIIPDSVTSLGMGAFEGCTSLASITIPDSVTSIGYEAFSDCTNLENIILPDNLYDITSSAFNGTAFYNNPSNWEDGVLYCGSHLIRANETVPASYTIKEGTKTIAGGAFMINYYDNIIVPVESVTIPESVVYIGDCAFDGCRNLTSVNIPDSVEYLGSQAFCDTGLKEITVPGSVKTINCQSFAHCKDLKKVTLMDGVEVVDYLAFEESYNITEFTVYNSLNKILRDAFYSIEVGTNCFLTDIYYYGTEEQWQNVDLVDPTFYEDVTVHFLSQNISDFTCTGTYEEMYYTGEPVIFSELRLYDADGNKLTEDTDYTVTYQNNVELGEAMLTINGIGKYSGQIEIPFDILCPYHCKDSVYYSEMIVRHNCEEGGVLIRDCSFCGMHNETELPAKEHSYLWVTVSEATCEKEGLEEKICHDCGYVAKTRVIEKTAHTPASEWTVIKSATCTDNGIKVLMCAECGEIITTEIIPAAHKFTHISIPATCTGNGTEFDYCMLCGTQANIRVIPAMGHSYEHYHTDASCTEPGEDYDCCANCNQIINYVEIPAPGHSLVHCEKAKTCIEDGYSYDECSVCHEKFNEVTYEACHEYSDWHITVNPTTTTAGKMVKDCSVCGEIFDEMAIPCLTADFVTGLTLSSGMEALGVEDSVTLTATISPETATNKNVIWTSANSKIASVENGIVTAHRPGTTVIIAESEDGGYCRYCFIRVISIHSLNGAVIDNNSALIYGMSANVTDITDYLEPIYDGTEVICYDSVAGTGSLINIVENGEIIDTFEAVIFGDVNGDGWYDGTDSVIVNCLANGLLSREQVGEAVYMAADCNHDDVIDENDVALLEQAGLILAGVDQSKSAEELMTDSAFVEYLNLIDQNPTEETPVEEATDVTPADEPIDEGFNQSFVERIVDFIIYIVNLMKSFIIKF